MKTWAVSCETGIIVEADEMEKTKDGRLVFYIDGEEPIEFPDGVWVDVQEVAA